MANTKKKTSTSKKRKTTKKKSTVSTTKKTTRNSSASATKKRTTTTAKKNNAVKKNTTKKTNVKAKEIESALVETEVTRKIDIAPVEFKEEDLKAELPKLKAQTREISKNKNVANKVVEEEKFTGIKSAKKQIKGKRKSKANFVSLVKNNKIINKLYKLKRKIRIYGITSVIPKQYIVGITFLLLFMFVLPTAIYFFQAPTAKMDLSDINQIDTLKTLSLNLDNVDDIISTTNAFTSLKNYDRYDFDSVFKLNSDYVDDFVIKYNESKKQLLFIIKPTSNNYDNVKNTVNAFLKEKKINVKQTFDYDGYIIYIKSKSEENDTIVKSKIMQSTKNVFTLLLDLKKDEIESTLKIPSNLYTEAVIKVARLKSDTCGYAIIKPSSLHAKNKIKSLMDDYYVSLENKWVDNKENLELVKNRYFEDYDGYLIYIVSNNNKLVMDLIKSK